MNIDKIFIMIGYNDLEFRSNHEIINNITDILSIIKCRKIYLQSLLPVKSNRKKVNIRILKLNDDLEKLCLKNGHTYIDLHSNFVDRNGGLSIKYSNDGCHPNVSGYLFWHNFIKEIVYEKELSVDKGSGPH